MTTLLAVTLVAGSVVAQPAIRRRQDRDNRRDDRREDRRDDRRDRAEQRGNDRLCKSRWAILNGERQRYERQSAELAGVDAEIAELQRRLADLSTRRRELQSQSQAYQRRLADTDALYKRECAAEESCDTYDSQVGDLERQTAPLQAELDRIGQDIGVAKRDVDVLSRQIEPLQREYGERRCNNLVPGETDQSTIDRCSAIFSDWNRYQGDLNRQLARLSELRARYQQSMSELRALETRAASYRTYMERNCARSAKTQVVRDYGRVQKNAERLGHELDQLVDTVTKLRGIRINISAQ